jgi:hypothetical protein
MTTYIDTIMEARPRARDALERVRPQMAALQVADLEPINLEPFVSASIVRGALPGLLALRPQMATGLYEFDISNLDLLETYALALLAAEAAYRAVSAKPERLEEAKKEGVEVRAQLVAHCTALAQSGLLPREHLAMLTVPNGYRNIGSDLLILSRTLRENWSKLVNKTPIEPADVERAEVLAEELFWALASRQQRTQAALVAADDRRRVYTLMVNAYNEVRYGVQYLRRRIGDADDIAPSLFRKRDHSRRKSRTSKGKSERSLATSAPQTSEITSSTNLPKDSIASSVSKNIDDPFIH